MRTKLLLAGILFTLLYPSLDCLAEISNRVVAYINNDVITLFELNNELNTRIKQLTGKTSEELKAEDEESFIEVRRQILESMMNEKIAQEKIQELGLQVTQEEIDSYIENLKISNNWTQEDLIANLKNQGMTLDELRSQIKKEQEQSSLISYEVKSKTVILEGQLQRYYQEHIDEFKEDELVRVAAIFLLVQDQENKDELNELIKKGEEILDRIKNGEDFGTLAKEFSEGPGADESGELGEYKTSEIDPELKKVIDGLTDGGVSGLIVRDTGIQIIKLIRREGGNMKPFEEVRNDIYETIYNEELNKRYMIWLKELRDKSFTKITF